MQCLRLALDNILYPISIPFTEKNKDNPVNDAFLARIVE